MRTVYNLNILLLCVYITMYKKHSFSKEVWKTSFMRTLGAGSSLYKWITACQQTESTDHGKQTVVT